MNNIQLAILTAAIIFPSLAYSLDSNEIRRENPQAQGIENTLDADEGLVGRDVSGSVTMFQSSTPFFKRVLTSVNIIETHSENFITLNGAKTTIIVPAGVNVLVGATFGAESSCYETNGSTDPNWCEIKILVDGAEASPQASTVASGSSLAFDSTDGGTETVESWESHIVSRHACVFNGTSPTFKQVEVEVQWKVMNHSSGATVGPTFWIDDWSLVVEMSRGCRERII